MRPISNGEVVQFNVFVVKPGMMDTFIETQRAGLPGFGDIEGLQASRLYRANDGNACVLVSSWESELAQQRFSKSAAFRAHRDLLLPLIESASPSFYTPVYVREGSKTS
jgi:heme-degrading monooxygenase HmoA